MNLPAGTILEKSKQGYLLVCARTRTGYGAHVPDLPGCVATGRTLAQMLRLMDGAIEMHLRGTRQDGLKVQRPRTLEALLRKRLISFRPISRRAELLQVAEE